MEFKIILTVFCLLLGQTVQSQGQFNKEELIANGRAFVQPFKSAIRDWFWSISGISRGPGPISVKADFLDCPLCTAALPALRLLINLNIPEELMVEIATFVCISEELAPRADICKPTIQSYVTSILFMIANRPDLEVMDICGIINPGCGNVTTKLTDWKVNVDAQKPQVASRPELPSNTETVKILQFTDIHLDLDYVEGMSADCGLPICCRAPDGPGPNATWSGGRYGHIYCGLPREALHALYDHASTEHQEAEFIFLTGDYVHSGVWLYSAEENGRHIKYVTEKLAETFPNTVIYPLTGNHEPDVVNMYAPLQLWNEFDLSWMYKVVSDPFAKHLTPYQLGLFKRYGYYTVTPAKYPNLRIIALNTNLCYINNFWLPYDAIDTGGQLQWFTNELGYAEKMGQHVLIIGHIQPGSGSCWPVWSVQFNRIVNRYEHIIRGQFYGHSHEQYYTLGFERGSDSPTSVSFIAGSGLTDQMNSAYNVYHLDGKRELGTWEIMNQETWVLNLNESNKLLTPKFDRVLNAKLDFKVKSMRPQDIYDLVDRMICDDELFLKYQEVKSKGKDSERFQNCISIKCKSDILGEIVSANSGDDEPYRRMEERIRNRDCSAVTGQPSYGTSLTPSLFVPIIASILSTLYSLSVILNNK